MSVRPLSGIRIVDLTHYLAGPFCTCLLGDLGAEIIKIEHGNGDATRNDRPSVNGTSGQYMSTNRGKKSVALNLKDEAHRKVFFDLVKTADVVTENYKPGTAKKLGVDYESLKAIKPDLIYVSISGYGQTGPYSKRAALDIAIQATSGFMSTTGLKDGAPTKAGASVGDVTSGVMGVVGVLSALMYKNKTGKGQYVDVAMLDCMVGTAMSCAVGRYAVNGEIPRPLGNRHPSSAPFQEFATKDGSIVICCPTDVQFKSLMEGLGRMDVYEDPRFTCSTERYGNALLLGDVLSPIIAEWTKKDLCDMLAGRGLAFGEINNVADLLENEQLDARGLFVDVEDSAAGHFKMTGFPLKMSECEFPREYHSPSMGEHTREVLQSVLGMSDAECDAICG